MRGCPHHLSPLTPRMERPNEPRTSPASPSLRRDLKCENILLDDQGLLKLTGEPVAWPHPCPNPP